MTTSDKKIDIKMTTLSIVGTIYCFFCIGFCSGDSIQFRISNKMKWLDSSFLEDFFEYRVQDYLLPFILSMTTGKQVASIQHGRHFTTQHQSARTSDFGAHYQNLTLLIYQYPVLPDNPQLMSSITPSNYENVMTSLQTYFLEHRKIRKIDF